MNYRIASILVIVLTILVLVGLTLWGISQREKPTGVPSCQPDKCLSISLPIEKVI